MLTELRKQKFDKVMFGDNGCGNALSICKIGKNSISSTEHVYLVLYLKYNY